MFTIILATTGVPLTVTGSFSLFLVAGIAMSVLLGRRRKISYEIPSPASMTTMGGFVLATVASLVATAILFGGLWLLFREVADRHDSSPDLADLVVSGGAGMMAAFGLVFLIGTTWHRGSDPRAGGRAS